MVGDVVGLVEALELAVLDIVLDAVVLGEVDKVVDADVDPVELGVDD